MDEFELKYPNNEKTVISNAKLKACPFCGGQAELTGVFPYGQYYIKCTGCRVSLWSDRADRTINEWNHRVNEDLKIV